MKKALRALGILSFFEIVVYLLVATAAWAIADHDLATLDSSFYADVRTQLHAQIMAGIQGLILIVNTVYFMKILRGDHPSAAYIGLLLAGGVVSLFFLPTMFSVYGLGGLLGLVVGVKALALLWKGVSWPFRKMFGRKKAGAEPASPKPSAPSKKAG